MPTIPRKPRTTTYRRRGSKGVRSTVAPPRRTPARFNYSRRTYRKNLSVAKTLAQFSEKKYKPFTAQDEVAPTNIQIGAQSYFMGFVGGVNSPSTWSGFVPIRGFQYPQGSGDSQRDGRYMYLNNSTINCSIHMNASERNQSPTQFRVLVFKARRALTPTGVSYDPARTLFLAPDGDATGHAVAGVNGTDLMLQPSNKRNWVILKDTKFTLQSPMASPSSETSSFQGKYASLKEMRINLYHKAKASFNNSTEEPEDFDFHYGMVIYSSSVARDQPSNTWEFNLRGTTTAFDN